MTETELSKNSDLDGVANEFTLKTARKGPI